MGLDKSLSEDYIGKLCHHKRQIALYKLQLEYYNEKKIIVYTINRRFLNWICNPTLQNGVNLFSEIQNQ